ncbi:MAG: Transcriptional regulator, TetR [Solirubrobacterales bacterium]|nr:Transcriptional regulator, TetR [Solirubrobacterales bacterium]
MGGADSTAPRRQQRGRERRDAIVDATLALLETEGLEAVTHRRVAEEAGVPLAATTYYFSSKEDLMQAAMTRLIEREAKIFGVIAEAVTTGGSMSVDEGVEAIIAYEHYLIREKRLSQFAEFELYLRVARTAADSDEVRLWPQAFREVAEAALSALGADNPRRDGHALVALIHGLVLHALTAPDPDVFAEEIMAPVLRSWFTQVLGPHDVVATSGD